MLLIWGFVSLMKILILILNKSKFTMVFKMVFTYTAATTTTKTIFFYSGHAYEIILDA